jgi:uncharacterized membrane protein
MTSDVPAPIATMRITQLVLILLATLSLALVMRLWGLTSEPVWLDEVYSVLLSEGSSDQILEANAKDVHPPAYYLGLARWRQVFGSTPAGIRGYSILWSLIGVALVVLLAADSGLDWRGVSFAGMVAAINPLDIYFAQEARMYAQATALGTASSWMLWRWLQGRRDRGSQLVQGLWLALYACTAAMLVQTLYLGAFVLLAQGLFTAIALTSRRDIRGLMTYGGASLATALLVLPWLVFMRHFGPHKLGRLDWMSAPSLTAMFQPFTKQFYVGKITPDGVLHQPLILLSGILSVALVSTLVLAWRRHSDFTGVSAYLSWITCIPIGLAFLVSHLYRPVYFTSRFPVLVLPTFLVLVAIAATLIQRPWLRSTLVILIVGVMAAGGIVQGKELTKPGMVGFAELYRQVGPPDHVVLLPPDSTITASYALGFPLVNAQQRQIQESIEAQGETVVWVGIRRGYLETADPRVRRVYEWLLSLGPKEKLAEVDGMEIWQINGRQLR